MENNRIVAVHGSYFADNYGDTLLVRILCDMAAAHVGRSNVFLAVEGDERELQDIGYPVVPKDKRDQVTHLLFGGGGYFGERSSKLLDNVKWSIRNYRRHLAWTGSFTNARRAVIGAGFGPISNKLLRMKVRSFMQSAELVLVRDAESLKFMQAYKISHRNSGTCVDLALSLPIADHTRSGVALHIDNFSTQEMDEVFQGLAAASMHISHVDVIFDNKPSDTVESRLKYAQAATNAGLAECNFFPYTGVDSLVARVATYELVVTSKLHVGITTIAQGGRAIAIPGHQKTIRLYKQLALERFCISRSRLQRNVLTEAVDDLASYAPDRSVIAEGLGRVEAALSTFLVK
ncbi:polysaccharide pyruvyl transferase family protein [Stenotrophomonas sp. NPDC078853]|uniref:polysaccharide pyruvyl transferase family protein n=1 Tax=Stenotrophomonas sp. NPDC078853 TaxID=3364534 RepID=UPI003850CB76